MSVNGSYERSSTNGSVQGFDFFIKDAFRINALSNAAQDGYEMEAQLFLSDTLAQNFNNPFFSVRIGCCYDCFCYLIYTEYEEFNQFEG